MPSRETRRGARRRRFRRPRPRTPAGRRHAPVARLRARARPLHPHGRTPLPQRGGPGKRGVAAGSARGVPRPEGEPEPPVVRTNAAATASDRSEEQHAAGDHEGSAFPAAHRHHPTGRGVLTSIENTHPEQRFWRRPPAAAVALALVMGTSGVASAAGGGDWPLANRDLSSTRADLTSGIDRANVKTLRVAWRFRFGAPAGASGVFTATPVVAARRRVRPGHGEQRLRARPEDRGGALGHRFFDETAGPNGVVVDGGRVYGATDTSAFALSATDREAPLDATARDADRALRRRRAAGRERHGLHQHDRGRPRTAAARSTRSPRRPGRCAGDSRRSGERGACRARPEAAARGIRRASQRARPTGASRTRTPTAARTQHPNGGAFAGPALYTDSLLAVAPGGTVAWFDQVTPTRRARLRLPALAGARNRRRAFARLRRRQGRNRGRMGSHDPSSVSGRRRWAST